MKQKFIIGDKVVVKNQSKKDQNLLVGDVVNIASTSRKLYLVSFSDGIQKWYLSYQLDKCNQKPQPKFREGDLVLVNAGFLKGCVGKTSAPFFGAWDEIRYQVYFEPAIIQNYVHTSETLPEKWLCPFTGQTNTIQPNEQLIQEAKEFAAAYIKDRNECVGKDWVDNVTDSWIYDSEDYWLERYHWKYGKDKQPSEEERKAYWDESFRLFNKQYAELFAERDAKLIVGNLFDEIVEKEKAAYEALKKLSNSTDNRLVYDTLVFVNYRKKIDERTARKIIHDLEQGRIRGCGFGFGF